MNRVPHPHQRLIRDEPYERRCSRENIATGEHQVRPHWPQLPDPIHPRNLILVPIFWLWLAWLMAAATWSRFAPRARRR